MYFLEFLKKYKLSPKQMSNVKLKAVWRKVKVVKNKKGKGFRVFISPKNNPYLTMVVSDKKNISQELKKLEHDIVMYPLWGGKKTYPLWGGKKTNNKIKDGMRVYNIKRFGTKESITNKEFEKGKTYYIWFKYGEVEDFEFMDVDSEERYSYIDKDAYYFYKTKITL